MNIRIVLVHHALPVTRDESASARNFVGYRAMALGEAIKVPAEVSAAPRAAQRP